MTATSNRPRGSVAYDNHGRVVLVSGGVAGIGRAIVDRFHATGAHVYSMDVSDASDQQQDRLTFLRGDTSVVADCENAVEAILADHVALDVLINNAAIQPPESYRAVHEFDQELWQRMININLTGYTNLARASLPIMLRQSSGVIVNVASGQGHRTAREVPAYGPIKAANIMQARQWGVEYARHGIRVVSVSPGAINTPLVRASLAAQGGETELANRHPQGRIGQPLEVANAVVWLCSQDASLITATDLEIDAGLGAFGAFADPFESVDPS